MIQGEINKADTEKIFRKLRDISPKQRGNTLVNSFTNATLLVERRLRYNAGGSILRRRSGRLAASIGSRVTVSADGLMGVVGSGVRQGNRVRYAGIQETGGTVTPKNVQYLTIPLQAALTAAGVLRRGAREWPDTFVKESKAGNKIIFQKRNKTIVPLFVLKQRVNIPASRYMSVTLQQMHTRVPQVMLASIERALNK